LLPGMSQFIAASNAEYHYWNRGDAGVAPSRTKSDLP
jgi:hypothetical protein